MGYKTRADDGRVAHAPIQPTHITAAATLKLHQQLVWAQPAGADYDLTLPPVAEAAGKTYTIISNGNAVGGVTVKGFGDEAGSTYASGKLTADGDFVIVLSTGLFWVELAELST